MKSLGIHLCASVLPVLFAAALSSAPAEAANAPHAGDSCRLGGGITHIVQIQFDNVHLRRDNPNVPSDLEQMPNLLNFLQGQVSNDTRRLAEARDRRAPCARPGRHWAAWA